MNACSFLSITLAALAACPVQAGIFDRDRPGTPTDVRVIAQSPTTIHLRFKNTGQRGEVLRFELEQKTNGVHRLHEEEIELSKSVGMSGSESATSHAYRPIIEGVLRNQQPEAEHCFRVWSRDSDGVVSENPSGWACATTPPFPPLAPLDVSIKLQSDLDQTPRISWNTPDQSSHRRIDRFFVERQTSPGPGRPWVVEARVPGPAGEQDASTQLAFAIEGARIDTSAKQVYRIRAENSGGHSDWVAVELVPPRKLVQAAKGTAHDKQTLEPAPRAQPRVAPTTPLSASAVASTLRSASAAATSTATAQASEARPQATSRVDPSGPVALNPQPLPPKATTVLDPSQEAGLNPQPLPPKAVEFATATRARSADPQQQGMVDPSSNVTLNPQPLPPKTTVLQRRETTVLPSGPMQTMNASGAANPQGQLQGAARLPTESSSPYGKAVEIKTEQLVCKGGPAFNLGALDLDPALQDQLAGMDQGMVIGGQRNKRAAGGGTTVLMQLNFAPARDARQIPVPAGENGEGLTRDSTCSFVNRAVQWNESPGIRFETAAAKADPSPDSKVKQAQHETKSGGSKQPTAEIRPDAETIPLYLSDPNHYWTFSVYNTGYGHFQAVSHGPWKPKAATQIAGVTENVGSQMTIARLTNVKVFPSMLGVGFRFIARPNAAPRIELEKEPPVTGRDGLKVFRNPVSMRADRDNKYSNDAVTQYVGASEAQGLRLSQDTTYHYIITVPGDGSVPIQQASGRFSTLYQTVNVYISAIRLLSVSDNDSTGDVLFHFLLNPGEPNRQSHTTGLQHWAPGKHNVGKVFEFRGDLQHLKILVEGFDKEDGIAACFLPTLSDTDPKYFETAKPSTNCGHSNVAKRVLQRAELDSRDPIPLMLTALVGLHGSELAFEVSGSIEVVRPR